MTAAVLPFPQQRRAAPTNPATTRQPPHDASAEAAVLDALINAPIRMEERIETIATLTEEHFHVEANRVAFPTVRDLAADGSPIDAVTVAARLRDKPAPEVPDGWVGYLGTVIADQGGASPASRREHVAILERLRRCREVLRVCDETAAHAAKGDDATALIETTTAALSGIAQGKMGTARSLGDVAHEVFSQLAQIERRPRTGYHALDRAIGALLGGQVTVIAARPKAGKTNLAWHVAENIAKAAPEEDDFPEAVFFVSAEMATKALYRRQLGIRARVHPDLIQDGRLAPQDWDKLTQANVDWTKLPIILDDFNGSKPTPAQIEAAFLRARDRLAAGTYRNALGYTYPRCKLRTIVIDHLGKLASPRAVDPKAGDPQRLQASMEATCEMSKRTDSHVLLLWHAGMRDKDPAADLSPADIRGTSDAEGSCDRMLFLTRPKPERLKIAHYVDRHREALGYSAPIWLETEGGVIWEAQDGQYA